MISVSGIVNVLSLSFETYKSNIALILFAALSFVIAFIIPIFASFPTYGDLGAIFLRTASIYINLNIINTSVIVISVLFSLLFLSFAIVAINVVVKHSRTRTRIKQEVLSGLEKYTSKVFIILFIYTAILFVINAATYKTAFAGISTAIVGLVLTPFLFYAPASIVIDDHRIVRAIQSSVKLFFRKFDYFLLWLAVAIVLLTFFDLLFLAVGQVASTYVMLIFDAFFILPFLVVLQSELYMKRFRLLGK